MAPINLPDGTEVSEVILPGGATASEVIAPDGTTVFGSAIPDTEIYLQDDFGDNKLQNRDDSGTTTYNGVTGTYRPEYTLDEDSPNATNEQLDLDGDDQLHTNINLNLTQTITWEFTDIDVSGDGGGSGDLVAFTLYAESDSISGAGESYQSSYALVCRSGDLWNLRRYESDGSFGAELINGTSESQADATVTRQPDGTWEFLINGVSQGTTTDTTFESPSVFGAGVSGAGDATLNEYKVS